MAYKCKKCGKPFKYDYLIPKEDVIINLTKYYHLIKLNTFT